MVKLLLVTIIINYDIHISIREGFLGMLFQQYFSPKNPIECLLGFKKLRALLHDNTSAILVSQKQ